MAERELVQCLDAAGAVLIEGPRACGKTATARRFAASEVLLDVDKTAQDMIDVDPGRVTYSDLIFALALCLWNVRSDSLQ